MSYDKLMAALEELDVALRSDDQWLCSDAVSTLRGKVYYAYREYREEIEAGRGPMVLEQIACETSTFKSITATRGYTLQYMGKCYKLPEVSDE